MLGEPRAVVVVTPGVNSGWERSQQQPGRIPLRWSMEKFPQRLENEDTQLPWLNSLPILALSFTFPPTMSLFLPNHFK